VPALTVTRSGLPGMLQALWVYRRFVLGMVGREFRGRYMGSLLGAVWAVLGPLATILIYLVVFSKVMSGRLPGGRSDSLAYGLFLCTGILVWGYFAETVGRCQVVFVESANLLKKMSFPRITLPVIVLLNASLNFLFVAALFLILLLAVGRFPGTAMLAFLPLLALQQAFAVGLGILLGTLHVFFRDVGQLWLVMLNLWFWSTPIVYHVDILPERFRRIIEWNPLTALFESYQGIVLEGTWPPLRRLALPAAVAILSLLVGLVCFRRLSGQMVDEL
jgi:homopolymeric O-antigen transport system permease protein